MAFTHDLSGGTVVITPLTSVVPTSGPGVISVPGAGKRVANLHSAIGQYYAAWNDGSGIRVQRWDAGAPTGKPDLDVHPPEAAGGSNPALIESIRHVIVLLLDSGGAILRIESGDRGKSWSSSVSQLPGILPAATVGAVGRQEVACAVQSDNSILITVQFPGQRWPNDNYQGATEATSSDAPYVAIDDNGAPLVTDGTGVALSPDPDGRIVMAVRIGSETDLSHWTSGDAKSRTWTRSVSA